MVVIVIVIIIVLLFLTMYLSHYLSTKHDQRVADSHERRQQHLEQTMERIRESDRKRVGDEAAERPTDRKND